MDTSNRYVKVISSSVIPPLVLPGIQLQPTGTDSFLVVFSTPSISKGIDHYLAKVKAINTSDIRCKVSATNKIHQCELLGLEPATKYTIMAQACLKNEFGCGEAINRTSATEPMGKLHLKSFISFYFIDLPCNADKLPMSCFTYVTIAPANMTTIYTTPTSIALSILPAPRSPEVTHYIVYLTGNSSEDSPPHVLKAKAEPMECEVTGLVEEQDYSVAVKSCVAWNGSDVCGESIEITAATTLSGVCLIITLRLFLVVRVEGSPT